MLLCNWPGWRNRAHGQCPLTTYPRALAHLTRSRPSSEVASSRYSYQRLFSIVKRKSRRSCDILIRAEVIAPEISVLAAPAGRTLTKGRPEEPAQMRLIRKANAQGYFAQWFRTGHHQVAGSLQTPLHHVGMWRLAES